MVPEKFFHANQIHGVEPNKFNIELWCLVDVRFLVSVVFAEFRTV